MQQSGTHSSWARYCGHLTPQHLPRPQKCHVITAAAPEKTGQTPGHCLFSRGIHFIYCPVYLKIHRLLCFSSSKNCILFILSFVFLPFLGFCLVFAFLGFFFLILLRYITFLDVFFKDLFKANSAKVNLYFYYVF